MNEFQRIYLTMNYYTDDSHNVTKYTGMNYTHWEPQPWTKEKACYGARINITSATDLTKVCKGLTEYLENSNNRKVLLITKVGASEDIANYSVDQLEKALTISRELDVY